MLKKIFLTISCVHLVLHAGEIIIDVEEGHGTVENVIGFSKVIKKGLGTLFFRSEGLQEIFEIKQGGARIYTDFFEGFIELPVPGTYNFCSEFTPEERENALKAMKKVANQTEEEYLSALEGLFPVASKNPMWAHLPVNKIFLLFFSPYRLGNCYAEHEAIFASNLFMRTSIGKTEEEHLKVLERYFSPARAQSILKNIPSRPGQDINRKDWDLANKMLIKITKAYFENLNQKNARLNAFLLSLFPPEDVSANEKYNQALEDVSLFIQEQSYYLFYSLGFIFPLERAAAVLLDSTFTPLTGITEELCDRVIKLQESLKDKRPENCVEKLVMRFSIIRAWELFRMSPFRSGQDFFVHEYELALAFIKKEKPKTSVECLWLLEKHFSKERAETMFLKISTYLQEQEAAEKEQEKDDVLDNISTKTQAFESGDAEAEHLEHLLQLRARNYYKEKSAEIAEILIKACEKSVARIEEKLAKEVAEKEIIGPRQISGWVFEGEEEQGNYFYDAVVHQLKKLEHKFLAEIPSETQARDNLRLRIQGEDFVDEEWVDQQKITKFLAVFNDMILAVADTRHPDKGFVYHWFNRDANQYAETSDETILPTTKPIVRIATTGDRFLSVVSYPNFSIDL